MSDKKSEKRKFDRYSTDAKVFFQVVFDLKTKVDFQLLDKETRKARSRRYSALSKNVSIEGLCFCCGQKLNVGDLLLLEVEIPGKKSFVPMQGEVCWSTADHEESSKFNTGVHLITVKDQAVDTTFQYNEQDQVVWSGVLEAIIGNFK